VKKRVTIKNRENSKSLLVDDNFKRISCFPGKVVYGINMPIMQVDKKNSA